MIRPYPLHEQSLYSADFGWGDLSMKSNVKMSNEYPKLPVMYNMSIVKKSNSWAIDETHNFNC